MLPPLPKKALKLTRSSIKRVTLELPKRRTVEILPAVADAASSSVMSKGYLRRGKPYLTVRERGAAAE